MNYLRTALLVLCGVALIWFGGYATFAGVLKSRTGKPLPTEFARIYGVVLAAFGVYVVVSAFGPDNKE